MSKLKIIQLNFSLIKEIILYDSSAQRTVVRTFNKFKFVYKYFYKFLDYLSGFRLGIIKHIHTYPFIFIMNQTFSCNKIFFSGKTSLNSILFLFHSKLFHVFYYLLYYFIYRFSPPKINNNNMLL